MGQGYPKLPSPSGSTGREVISEGTDRDATGSIWTGSTTSSPRGSLGRSEGSRQAGKQRASLVEIVSQITKRTESALVIPQGDLLRRAVELLLLANPRGTSGRLMETAVGPNSSWRLELTVLNRRSASRVTEQPGTAHKRPDRPDHRMIRWIDLTWSVHHHSNTVQL